MQPTPKILGSFIVDQLSSGFGLKWLYAVLGWETSILLCVVFVVEDVFTLSEGFVRNELRTLHPEKLEVGHYFF